MRTLDRYRVGAVALAIAACKSPPAAPPPATDATASPVADGGADHVEPARAAPRREGPEVLVTLLEAKGTGKRHQSFFFTFQVDAVLVGALQEKLIVSQELFSDFGGQQLLGRVGREPEPKRQIVLKLVRGAEKPERWVVFWSARPGEVAAARQLERAVDALVDAVERKDATPLRALLAAGSNVDDAVIRRIAAAHAEEGQLSFATLADLALLGAHDDVAYVASHARVSYTIELRRDATRGWQIGRFEAR